MGNLYSTKTDFAISRVALCHGKEHVRKVPKNYYLVDSNPTVHANLTADVYEAVGQFPNNSLDRVRFVYCNVSVLGNPHLYKWFKKVKIGGILGIFGPNLKSRIYSDPNNPTYGPSAPLQTVIALAMKKSDTLYKVYQKTKFVKLVRVQ
jgi:hypothetical protein